LKLLLVEDDATTAESIRLCFEVNAPDTAIVSTGTGTEAVQKVKSETLDAVILDLGLPDIDGIKVLEQVRTFSRVPVIVLSARHGADVISKALVLGADDYITKPFDYRILLDRLNILIKAPYKNA
jgi:DNA-binding response OmpR family regulator